MDICYLESNSKQGRERERRGERGGREGERKAFRQCIGDS